jgi:uncharacterized protein YggL (DUF469 family)
MSGACPVLGFTIRISLRDGVTTDTGDAIIADLVDLLETNGMSMGGGGERVFELVVTRDATQTTDVDRQLVLTWTKKWTRDANFHVTDIFDTNTPN